MPLTVATWYMTIRPPRTAAGADSATKRGVSAPTIEPTTTIVATHSVCFVERSKSLVMNSSAPAIAPRSIAHAPVLPGVVAFLARRAFDRLPVLGARLVAALPVVFGTAQRPAGGLITGRAERRVVRHRATTVPRS